MIQLDAVQTVAFAGLTLFAGYALCRAIPFFRRYNLPEPVVGGLLVALAVWWAHSQQTTLFTLDTTLKTPLMVAFFTTLGINASVRLLRVSGKQVMLFLLIGSIFAVLQNLIGISVAKMFGLNPMFGVLAGSATLTGGPATGLAFAGHFEQAGLVGAESLAVTAAMAGIICGGLVGGPVITVLMQRFKVKHPSQKATGAQLGEDEAVTVRYPSESAREFDALKSIVVLLMAMWLGVWVGKGFEGIGLTLPTYIGAMLVGHHPQHRRLHRLDQAVGADHRSDRQHLACPVPGHRADGPETLGTGWHGLAVAGQPDHPGLGGGAVRGTDLLADGP
jgi:ESS family glutamate:Na+ symporter